MLDDNSDDAYDAALFRLWIRMASRKPGATAVALVKCVTPDDYRTALRLLAERYRINLPPPPK